MLGLIVQYTEVVQQSLYIRTWPHPSLCMTSEHADQWRPLITRGNVHWTFPRVTECLCCQSQSTHGNVRFQNMIAPCIGLLFGLRAGIHSLTKTGFVFSPYAVVFIYLNLICLIMCSKCRLHFYSHLCFVTKPEIELFPCTDIVSYFLLLLLLYDWPSVR